MRITRSVSDERGAGGALALFAACGLAAAVVLLALALERLGTVTPMAYVTVAADAP
ncbi:MAG: hypothetical protein OHK0044_09290 [Burkholderiaceae bacterium]